LEGRVADDRRGNETPSDLTRSGASRRSLVAQTGQRGVEIGYAQTDVVKGRTLTIRELPTSIRMPAANTAAIGRLRYRFASGDIL
jgi:hypothetical protein